MAGWEITSWQKIPHEDAIDDRRMPPTVASSINKDFYQLRKKYQKFDDHGGW